MWPTCDDPPNVQLCIGATLGLLGIEPQTQRRNRMNGTVVAVDERDFELRVDQSFGNCPQYIQAREARWVGGPVAQLASRREGPRLSTAAAELVARADTLFIASAAPGQGADASHRGGKPGFERVDHDEYGTVLTFPDFRGNFFFNTLGNITAHPRAFVLCVDHGSGGALQLTGHAVIVAGVQEVEAFAGAQRPVRVEEEAGVWTAHALPLRWSAPQPASQLATAGHW